MVGLTHTRVHSTYPTYHIHIPHIPPHHPRHTHSFTYAHTPHTLTLSLPFSTESSLYSLFTYGFGANPCNVVDLPGVTHLRKTDSAFPRISLVRCENSRSPPCTLPNCSLGFILCRSPAWNQSCCDHIGTVMLHLKPLLCLSPPSHWLSHLSSPPSLCV